MEKIELAADKRSSLGKKNRALRAAGKIPAVVYGHGAPSVALELDEREIARVYRQAGGSKIVALKVGETKAKNVLIHDVQVSPLRGELTHVDFYVVKMNEVLKAEVPLQFVGESVAVYQQEGSLMKNLEAVEVECLPGDLPDSIQVDLAKLVDFETTLTLDDLVMPDGVKLVEEDLTVLIAKVEPPRSDEEMAELDTAVDGELPEGVKEEDPTVVSEENEGDKDRRDKK